MRDVLSGDPAACSRAGGTLLRTAERLRADVELVRAVRADVEEHWSSRAGTSARRRIEDLAVGMSRTARSFDDIGRALQEHSGDLSESLQEMRLLRERAETEGLGIEAGRVVPAWGVTGEASPALVAEREAARARTQQTLDALLNRLDRRRAHLAAIADEARTALAATSADLR